MKSYADVELVQVALSARENAYVPYSRYRVGAAVQTASGQIYSGCNIENSSYGLTVCAERVAIFKALSQGEKDFSGLAVAVDTLAPASPCGACRQVISEFFVKETPIYLVNTNGEGQLTDIGKILPGAFGLEDLLDATK